ncbi:MAG: nitroreductase family protein [Clostridiales bacterium]|nr:nitroreductase family protein [Clostridiales bacterium]
MDAIEALKTRRSFRKFSQDPVDPAVLDRVLETTQFAPSGRGLQSPLLVVVQDKETVAQLSRMNAAVMGAATDPYYGAPAIILAFAPNDVTTYIEDASCALTYLQVAAHVEGLASVWIHRERQMFQSDEGKALMEKWGIDAKYEGIGSVAIGYAGCDLPDPAPRREGYVLKV